MLENYHVTENKYLESILTNGLVPQKGIRSKLIDDSQKAVFYSKGYKGVIAMFFMMIERYIEYRGSEGDIHINSYNIIKEMIEDRENDGRDVSEYLRSILNKELERIKIINIVRMCSNYKEFLGDGVCLKLNNVPEEKTDLSGMTFYNSWTNHPIFPEDISVVVLKNQNTGEILSSKYDIINYFMSKVSLEEMKKVLYDDDMKESKRESHLLWQIMSSYYKDNKDYLETFFEKYDIVEIPISSYLNKKDITK